MGIVMLNNFVLFALGKVEGFDCLQPLKKNAKTHSDCSIKLFHSNFLIIKLKDR